MPSHQTLTLTTPDGEMPAHLWVPDSGSGPGLVLFQEIFGVSRYIRQRGEDLAALGYVVLAPALYWRLDASDEEPTDVEAAMGLAGRLDPDETVRDGVTAYEALQQRAEVSGGSGVIGFCFGGGVAYQVGGLTGADVVVAYYGSALADLIDVLPPVSAPSLHHFGLADQYMPGDTVPTLKAKLEQQPATTVLTWEGADHAFDNPDFFLHHPEASAQAWERTSAWLAEHLPVGS